MPPALGLYLIILHVLVFVTNPLLRYAFSRSASATRLPLTGVRPRRVGSDRRKALRGRAPAGVLGGPSQDAGLAQLGILALSASHPCGNKRALATDSIHAIDAGCKYSRVCSMACRFTKVPHTPRISWLISTPRLEAAPPGRAVSSRRASCNFSSKIRSLAFDGVRRFAASESAPFL